MRPDFLILKNSLLLSPLSTSPLFCSITFHKEVAVEQIICLFVASLQPSQKGFKDCFKNISYIISPCFISADDQDMTFSQKQGNYIPVFTEQCCVILYFFVLMSKIVHLSHEHFTFFWKCSQSIIHTKSTSSWESHSHLRGECSMVMIRESLQMAKPGVWVSK